MLVEPFQLAADEIDLVIRFGDAVPFARVAYKDGFDAALSQRAIVLLGLRDGDAAILLAVRDHQRRLDAIRVAHGRPLFIGFARRPAVLNPQGRLAASRLAHGRPFFIASARRPGHAAKPYSMRPGMSLCP